MKVFEILTRAVLYTYGSFQIEEDEFIIEHMDSQNGNYDLNFLKKHLSRPRYLIYERIKYHFQKKMPDTQCNVTNFSEQANLEYLIIHSMAKDNLNKSKETTPTTSAALKVAP